MWRLPVGVVLFVAGFLILRTSGAEWAGRAPFVGRYLSRPGSAFMVSLLCTACLHSSSAFLALLLGFAESGRIPTAAGLAAALGANVGTTFTALLASFPTPNSALAAAGFLLWLLGRVEFSCLLVTRGKSCGTSGSPSTFGLVLLGLGVLLAGMEFIEGQAQLLTGWPPFEKFLASCRSYPAGVLAGTVSAALLQSSTLLVGFLMGLVGSGKLALPAAIALVVGANIGTTADVLLAAAGAGRRAKQVAFGHLLLNVLGAALFLLCPKLLVGLVQGLEPARALAAAHTLFNLSGFLFWPFLPSLARLLERICDFRKERK